MHMLSTYISIVRRGMVQLVFPDICICCGQEALQEGHHICPFCLEKRFEYADTGDALSTGNVILPDKVLLQYALWNFDKGGLLQELMHNLKYERLTGIGYQLGKELARRVRRHPVVRSHLIPEKTVLVPVPLHYLKYRKRGFNQAFSIARGLQQVLSLPICPIDMVKRKKYTQSQTGFSLEKRIDNMQNAFSVARAEEVKGKTLIIVDDVFTTGATSFELAQTLILSGATAIMIWTVAQA